ncbi:hypothetical protein V5O48_004603 [Marasmius crinis-equi]|uniref:Uncharacterized protein n=1 Tax=Marasmius crinis-equi TaxID=585013 RepID=A0ABR3FPL5_9AGAR
MAPKSVKSSKASGNTSSGRPTGLFDDMASVEDVPVKGKSSATGKSGTAKAKKAASGVLLSDSVPVSGATASNDVAVAGKETVVDGGRRSTRPKRVTEKARLVAEMAAPDNDELDDPPSTPTPLSHRRKRANVVVDLDDDGSNDEVNTLKKRRIEDHPAPSKVPDLAEKSGPDTVGKLTYPDGDDADDSLETISSPSSDGLNSTADSPVVVDSQTEAKDLNSVDDGSMKDSLRDQISPRGKVLFRSRLQFRETRTLYNELSRRQWIANLRPKATILPYPHVTEEYASVVITGRVSKVVRCLDVLGRNVLGRALLFDNYRNFISPTRVAPSTVRMTYDGAVMNGGDFDGEVAVMVLQGIVMQSSLQYGVGFEGSRSKRLIIQLFSQEFEIFEAWLGTVAEEDRPRGPVNQGALTFQTLKENAKRRPKVGQGNSPSKSDLMLFSSGPSRPSAGSGRARPFPSALSYDSKVPLYDGRPDGTKSNHGFLGNRTEAWDNLTTLPLYPHPELDIGTVVSVGFALSVYNVPDRADRHFHLNLLFAVVLGCPVRPDDFNEWEDSGVEGDATDADDNDNETEDD